MCAYSVVHVYVSISSLRQSYSANEGKSSLDLGEATRVRQPAGVERVRLVVKEATRVCVLVVW